MKRRRLLQTAGLTPLPLATIAGLLPRTALAAWPAEAFETEQLDESKAALFSDQPIETSDRVTITAPDIAENGRVVPVELVVDLPNPRSATLFSRDNPFPLLARVHFTTAVVPKVSFRVKLGQSTELIAVVEADGGLYRTTRAVKVTAGGCGGG